MYKTEELTNVARFMTLASRTAVLIRYKAEQTVDEAISQLLTRRHYNVIIHN